MRRFTPIGDGCFPGGVEEDPKGEYVLYEEIWRERADLLRRIEGYKTHDAAWEAREKNTRDLVKELRAEGARLRARVRELEAGPAGEVERLRAELKALRETLAARQTAAEYSRRREEAEAARAKVLEMERDQARKIAADLDQDNAAMWDRPGWLLDWKYRDDPPT